MPQNRKIIAIGALAALIIIAAGAAIWYVLNVTGKQEVSTDDPVDVVGDFYDAWLLAAQSTSTNPYDAGLAKSRILSKELRKEIAAAHRAGTMPDPVLCQTVLPTDVGIRTVFNSPEETQVLVTARKSTSTEQAIVTLRSLEEGWYINSIKCSPGEFAPEREFTFDRDGVLLKNVPAPLDPQKWHLLFEENGEPNHYVPLFFAATTMCQPLKGAESACAPDTFAENAKVHIQGDMTELGVEVKRLIERK